MLLGGVFREKEARFILLCSNFNAAICKYADQIPVGKVFNLENVWYGVVLLLLVIDRPCKYFCKEDFIRFRINYKPKLLACDFGMPKELFLSFIL